MPELLTNRQMIERHVGFLRKWESDLKQEYRRVMDGLSVVRGLIETEEERLTEATPNAVTDQGR